MVYIYALCDVYYDSFYIDGIKQLFPSYRFNIDKFPKFKQGVFAVLITYDNFNIRLVIDSKDTDQYDEEALKWCDIYGKVNYRNDNVDEEKKDKIKPIGPSFGVKTWSFPVTVFYSLNNFFKSKKFISNKKEFLANYWRQYRRLPLTHYQHSSSSLEKYIFFTGSIWKKESLTNEIRAAFITACKKNKQIVFEGGFAPRNDGNNFNFDSLIVSKRYGLKEYIRKIKQSSIAFNTPAVLSCHGWKLGEFLALGKAIITTKHINELPADLEDNVHAIYADSLAKLDDKINLILNSGKLKNELEKNAKNYFDTYLAPKSVVKRLLSSKLSL